MDVTYYGRRICNYFKNIQDYYTNCFTEHFYCRYKGCVNVKKAFEMVNAERNTLGELKLSLKSKFQKKMRIEIAQRSEKTLSRVRLSLYQTLLF